MEDKFIRTEALLGHEKMEILKKSRIAVFGVGGVGSYVAEALARCGVGGLYLFDHDVIACSNINRQIHATTKTIGKYKVDEMKERLTDINPDIKVYVDKTFVMPENINRTNFSGLSYVVDAVDTVTAKIIIIETAIKYNIPIISCMGTGNKLHPEKLKIEDIFRTSVCPLARDIRRELRKRDVKSLKVCYSTEEPVKKLRPPGSVSFVPSAAGLLIAAEVINGLH